MNDGTVKYIEDVIDYLNEYLNAVDEGEDDPRTTAISKSGFKPNPQLRSHRILKDLLNGR